MLDFSCILYHFKWLIGKFKNQKGLEMNGRVHSVLMHANAND